MNYITARWNLIKDVSDTQINVLHNIEKAIYSYRFSKKYQKNKIIMPIWWQAGIKWLGLNGDFWKKSADFSERLKMHLFALKVKENLIKKNIIESENILFKDIFLMHQCDLEIKKLLSSSSNSKNSKHPQETQNKATALMS